MESDKTLFVNMDHINDLSLCLLTKGMATTKRLPVTFN